jgi:1-aminocyclopropane-1-carboxylate deaminase/D-cysteine desulfhydrase-like pyridoxal-dependent ACC family enzyme
MIALFRHYPSLKNRLPYVSLGQFPTPVTRLAKLGARLGIDRLYMKRDDRSGLIYGGNKVRKLEFLLGQATREGAGAILCRGCAGSNFVAASAIYAAQIGLRCIAVLIPQPNAHYIRRNLLIDHRYGAELHFCSDEALVAREIERLVRLEKEKHGSPPQMIPFGGSSPLGTVGAVSAGLELADQVRTGEIPPPGIIYVPFGSMGTSAGILLGLKAATFKARIITVRVVGQKWADPGRFSDLFRETNQLIHSLDATFPVCRLAPDDIDIRDEFFGDQYASFTSQGVKAISVMSEAEGINLDGTYTGKTLAALIADSGNRMYRDKTVLFWNTLNSRDLMPLVADQEYRNLPLPFHTFFESQVQPLDR